MSGFLDTSMVVRYLTGDVPVLAQRASAVMDGEDELLITGEVVAEAGYMLTTAYQLPRELVVEHLSALLRKRNLTPYGLDKGLVLQGLLLCRGHVSFTDAMVWAAAKSAGTDVVYTLEDGFPDDGIEVRK
ncbi:MAG: type II toxin-antitoxin system VapC family toxin [SAR202 cluster bacterium]|nr:VapC toxin family PIN domain ribonuclease [Gemmatimonadota bacterium]MQG32738.1 type II toxin-antitoxin system VapC family toxin [SAR202 cluster bacterium]